MYGHGGRERGRGKGERQTCDKGQILQIEEDGEYKMGRVLYARYLFIHANWRSRKGPRIGSPVVLRAVRHTELNPHNFGIGCNRALSADGCSGGRPSQATGTKSWIKA
jgi:hypothetical protein